MKSYVAKYFYINKTNKTYLSGDLLLYVMADPIWLCLDEAQEQMRGKEVPT